MVRRIQRQHARGDSLCAIADSLNADVAPTGQGAQWYAAAVRRAVRLDDSTGPPFKIPEVAHSRVSSAHQIQTQGRSRATFPTCSASPATNAASSASASASSIEGNRWP